MGTDTLRLAPVLFAVYILVELLEHRLSHATAPKVSKTARTGPLFGALLGLVPQCGFSVASSCLYSEGLITSGTLLATFISTSDEALPVLLAEAGASKVIAQILITKLFIAICVGYVVDVYYKHPTAVLPRTCGCHTESHESLSQLLVNSLVRTLKIVILTFSVSIGIEIGIAVLGSDTMENLFLQGSLAQPVATAIIGLIPSCGVSVALAEFFLKGTISFGAAIAGLCSSSGMGILVLAKENKNARDTFRIILILLTTSITSGLLIELLRT